MDSCLLTLQSPTAVGDCLETGLSTSSCTCSDTSWSPRQGSSTASNQLPDSIRSQHLDKGLYAWQAAEGTQSCVLQACTPADYNRLQLRMILAKGSQQQLECGNFCLKVPSKPWFWQTLKAVDLLDSLVTSMQRLLMCLDDRSKHRGAT